MSKVVYIAGKYSLPSEQDKEDYLLKAEKVAQFLLENGFSFIIPHKQTYNWEYIPSFLTWSSEDWLNNYCIPLLNKCDYLIVSSGYSDSEGVQKEVEYALDKGIPVFYNLQEFKEFFNL